MRFMIAMSLCCILAYSPIYSQTCKVEDELLNLEYTGDCKRGRANGTGRAVGKTATYEGEFKKGKKHGKGTYTIEGQSIYEGEFKNDKMDGEGSLTLLNDSEESKVLKGFFKNDQYMGEFEDDYKIISQQGIRNILIQKSANDLNQVRISVFANGSELTRGVTIRDMNNSLIENRNAFILTNVHFPL